MAFPEDPLGTRVELQIGGVWTDVTQHALTRDIITHKRGRTGEGQAVDPASCTLGLKSPNGLYSPRNPRSPYFGKLGRNTPMRVSLHAGTPYLAMPGTPGTATTPHHASLAITGDLDLRWEGEVDWGASGDGQMLIGKWGPAGSRSYHLRVEGGFLYLVISTDGTTGLGAWSRLPAGLPRHAAVRATLDVDNGAGGYTFRLYWARTLAGPWTQFNSDAGGTGPGVVSVFSGTAPVSIAPEQPDAAVPRLAAVGRCYRAEVRNGINGTIVAAPDFGARPVGATSFTDSAGRPWTVAVGAITNRQVRFSGEYSDWPPRWGRNGALILVEGEGAGILRRLNQGQAMLQSTLRRRIPAYNPVAYWPMEEGSDAAQVSSPIAGVAAFTPAAFDFAADDTLPGSLPLPVIQPGAAFVAKVPPTAAGTWQVELVYNLDAMPVAPTTLFEVRTTGTARRVRARVATNQVTIDGLDQEDTQVFTTATTAPQFTGTWNRLQIKAVQSGATTRFFFRWIIIGGTGFSANVAVTATPGYVLDVRSSFGVGLEGLRFGHLAVFASETDTPFNSADQAFNREPAGTRLLRLGAEEDIPVTVIGNPADQAAMGPQRSGGLLELLEQCEAADGGILVEDRERLGLRYRGRTTLYNQSPAITLSYRSRGLGELEPIDDDSNVRNDLTVERIGGSSARAVLEAGALSVQPPPAGVGRYDDSVSLNLWSDEQTEPMAWWLLHLGTWDEPRYPTVTLRLHKAPALIPAVLGITEGDLIRITDLPDWLPPGPLDLMVQGYTERIGTRTWEIDLVCAPAGPYQVGVLGDAVAGRVDANPGGSTLQAAVGEADTALVVHTPAAGPMGPAPWITSSGPAPTYPAELPVDVRVAGEVMRATAIRPWAWDSFGRTVAAGSWGTSTGGQAWTLVGGTASDRSVNGARGVISLPTAPSTVRFQTVPGQVGDCEVRCRMSVSALALGAAFLPAVLLRYVDTSSYYRARVHFGTGGAMSVSVTRDVTQVGAEAALPYTYTGGSEFEVRVRLTGHLVQMRVWPVGQLEPSVWHIERTVTTSPIAAGQVGLTASTFSGNTNVSPQLFFDEFTVPTPQTWTVARSVNGVRKSQAAGAEVRVERPAVLAL